MKKAVIGIGIPGSGKSTVLREFAQKYGYSYICPDDIRTEMTGDAADQSKNREVWIEAYERARKELFDGKTIVFDATFTHQGQRKEFLDFLRKNGAEKIEGIFVDTPFELAKERNLERERRVPDFALDRMNESLKALPPDLTDGFDALFTLNENRELKITELALGKGKKGKRFESLR